MVRQLQAPGRRCGESVMSRNIPPVRTWRVRYFLNRILLAEFEVLAPTKRFARWTARDRFMMDHLDRYLAFDRVTVSLLKPKEA